ncbi:MAG: SCP2 sterol-binding domain-containing protein [Deltaproteobacteria bacterium]|nr:SCP2 sterol-binding domain-containing protein [Deltaproteobacteria bacterium]
MDELYTTMTQKANEVELTSPAAVTIVLDITGADPKVWQVDVNGTKISVKDSGEFEKAPSLKITTSDEILLKVACREINPVTAFFTGKIKVKGDIGLVSHLKRLWPGD